jgi:hypothetical protein
MSEKFVSQVNGSDLYAKRAERTRSGVNLETFNDGTSDVPGILPAGIETPESAEDIQNILATKKYVQDQIGGVAGAMIFKDVVNGTTKVLPTTGYKAGWTYEVAEAGTYAGQTCEVGDMIICVKDYASGTAANSDWAVIQKNLDGIVIGPASAVDERIAVFDGTSGKLLKDGGASIVSTVNSESTNAQVPTAAAVNTAIGSAIGDLDLDTAISNTAGKTVATITEQDGIVGATFQDIAIESSQITDKMSTYDGTGTDSAKVVTGAAVKAALDTLNVSDISGFGAGKTLATLTETDGKIAATFQDIAINGAKVTVTDGVANNFVGIDASGNLKDSGSKAADFATADHVHGNITNAGALQTADVTIADGDKLVITDSSDSSKVARASVAFDGSTTTTALTPKGTFESFAKAADITSAIEALDGTVTGTPGAGQTLTAFSQTDGVVSATFGDIAITSSQVSDKQTTTFDGTGANKDKLVTGEAAKAGIDAAINALDVDNISGFGAGKTLATLTETDGKIAATFQDIQIAESQVTNLTTDLGLKAPLASPEFTGTPTAPTASTGDDSTQIATTAFVQTAVAQGLATADALVYKGTVAGGSTGDYGALTNAANKGDVYKVTTAGKVDGVAVEVGDMLICNTDNTAAATADNYETVADNWDFIQTNLDGVVIGPASSTDAHIALFDGASGKLLKDGAKSLSDFATADHVHGNISNDGKIGSTANLAVVTTTGGEVTTADLSVTAPTASGDTLAFIDSISQDSKGQISVTKKSVTVDSTYSASGTNPVNGTAIAAAIGTLDVDSVGGSGKYLSAISETDGKISATASDISSSVAESDTAPVSGGAVYTALQAKQDNLVFDGTYDATTNKVATVSTVTTEIGKLDVSDISGFGAGKTLATLTETDGKIAATFQDIEIAEAKVTGLVDDLAAKANKSEMSVEAGTGTDADKTTITLKEGTSATVLTTHQNISGKADKVSPATSGNFAGLDSNGNLTDSGSKAADFATSAQGGKADSAIQGVTANGTTLTVDTNKVIDIPEAGSSTYGVVTVSTITIP